MGSIHSDHGFVLSRALRTDTRLCREVAFMPR